MTAFDFNVSDYGSEEKSYDLLPDGKYDVIVADAKEKLTKKGDRAIEISFQVVSGQFQNRLIWETLNVWNSSDTARNIARDRLSQICKACGVPSANSSDAILGKKLTLNVGHRHNDYKGADENQIKSFAACSGVQQQAYQQPQQQPSEGRRPW
jgi:hypothetical protein